MPKNNSKIEKDKIVIYRPWITLKNGTRIYAKNYGKKVFRLVINPEEKDNY